MNEICVGFVCVCNNLFQQLFHKTDALLNTYASSKVSPIYLSVIELMIRDANLHKMFISCFATKFTAWSGISNNIILHVLAAVVVRCNGTCLRVRYYVNL